MNVEQVDFVSVPTRDYARAVDWYRNVLGLPQSEFSDEEIETPNVTFSFWKPEEQGELFVANQNGIALRVADVAVPRGVEDRRRRAARTRAGSRRSRA